MRIPQRNWPIFHINEMLYCTITQPTPKQYWRFHSTTEWSSVMRREEDDYDVIRFDVGRNGRNEKKVQSSPVETAQQTANSNENWQKKWNITFNSVQNQKRTISERGGVKEIRDFSTFHKKYNKHHVKSYLCCVFEFVDDGFLVNSWTVKIFL